MAINVPKGSELLTNAVMLADGETDVVDVALIPNIPEFCKRKIDSESEVRDVLKLCEQNDVLPYLALNFDNSLQQFSMPTIKYIGPIFGGMVDDEPMNFCSNPIHFVNNPKWYRIFFRNHKGGNVDRVKESVRGFLDMGYIVRDFSCESGGSLYGGFLKQDNSVDFVHVSEDYMERIRAYKSGDIRSTKKSIEGVMDSIMGESSVSVTGFDDSLDLTH